MITIQLVNTSDTETIQQISKWEEEQWGGSL